MPTSMGTGKKIDLRNFLASLPEWGDKHLGILLCANETRFSLSHHSSDTHVQYFQVEMLDESVILDLFEQKGKDFKTVDVHSADREVTLVPDGLFSENTVLECLEGVFGKSRNEHKHSFIETVHLHSLFRVAKEQFSALVDCFPQMKIHHIVDTVITKSWVDLSFTDGVLFRVHIEGNVQFIFSFKGKGLTLFNTHSAKGPTDVVYHTLNTIQGLEIDFSDADIACSGDLSPESEAYILLKSYCPRTRFLGSSSENADQREFILDNHRFCEL